MVGLLSRQAGPNPHTLAKILTSQTVILCAIIIVAASSRFVWLNTLISRDEGAFGYVGWRMMQGDVPYRDTLDNKGPLLYLFYGLGSLLFGNSIIPLRLFNNLLFLASIVIIFRLAHSWYGRSVATWSAIFYGAFMSVPVFEGQLASSESFMIPLVLAAMYSYGRYQNNASPGWLLGASMLASVAVMIRPTAVFLLFVLGFMLVLDRLVLAPASHVPPRQRLKGLGSHLVFFLTGFLIPVVPFLLYFGLNYAMDDAFRVLVLNTFGYVTGWIYVEKSIRMIIVHQGLPLFLFSALGSLVLLLRITKLTRNDLLLALWTGSFVVVVTRPPMFGHYFLQIIPPLSVLAAVAIGTVTLVSRQHPIRWVRAVALLCFLWLFGGTFAYSFYSQKLYFPTYRLPSHVSSFTYADSESYSDQLRLASYLRKDAATNGGLTLVHGMSAEVYWLAGLKSPTVNAWSLNIGPQGLYTIGEGKILPLLRQGDIVRVVLFEQYITQADAISQYTLANFRAVQAIGSSDVFQRIIQNPTMYTLDDSVALVGYDLDESLLRAGDTLELSLYWRALARLQQDYTVFVHLSGQDERIWSQVDSQPQRGNYPTSSWNVGELVTDTYELHLPPGVPVGAYRLWVGMYSPESRVRLAVFEAIGVHQVDDRIELAEVLVSY